MTPSQRHSGEEQSILVNREAVYETAKQRNPERWSPRNAKLDTSWRGMAKPRESGRRRS
ncbi:MAG: hypothetical protein KZQ66_15960 [Candidatus Thiodiazotropha sp. (ex Lucinoma aequizonata)]|nr:hypothetical protein [Candidatus Thiodiazotropha sp. (ex Lucinoma aequizonata)]MCU7899384.1 hypothetical protein [Candidatus Thiodiazotropha sp. (ex Lucinoma aequizonata)]MCU7903299.1 hypothetical protein [Candidatus Thiodiazotropha sp. (ex Lucinoma aequizonata)]MCU7910729.1 hypothetical protein [Candidatus Thiodiazotropha sp. (ex Lucinoma aequizonata)]